MDNPSSRTSSSSSDPSVGKYAFSDLMELCAFCVFVVGAGSFIAGVSIDIGAWYMWFGALLGGLLMFVGCAFLVLLFHYRKRFRAPYAKR
jgi:hypothetical protein